MKKKILLLITLLLTITLTGCKKEETVEPIKITSEDNKIMETVSELIYDGEKDNFKIEDLTDEKKEIIARNLVEGNLLETTGAEMQEKFNKYFGTNIKIEFHDIPCFMTHANEEEQILYKFNKETDKYEYNDKHPGHGGGGTATKNTMMQYYSLVVDGNTIDYYTKVLYYGPTVCHDIGGCEYGKLYKTYKDYKNETNSILDISNSKYTTKDENDFPKTDLDAVLNDYMTEGTSIRFTFIKENDKLTFKEYNIE